MKLQGTPHKNPKHGPFIGVLNSVPNSKIYFSTIHFNMTIPLMVQIPESKVTVVTLTQSNKQYKLQEHTCNTYTLI
jgi:hypothetical protein